MNRVIKRRIGVPVEGGGFPLPKLIACFAALTAVAVASAEATESPSRERNPVPESVTDLPSPNTGTAEHDAAYLPDPSIASVLPQWLADPGGVRRGLGAKGITFGVNYIGEVFGNVSGGFEQGALYDGLLEIEADVDLAKFTRLNGLTFHSTFYQIHGQSITGENVGSIAAVTDIEAFPSTRLFEAWFEQKIFNEKLSLRIGQLAVDEEFLNSDGAGAFISSAFGWPTLTSANFPFGGPIYPLATPGARLKYEPNEKLALLAAIYNGDPVGPCPDDLDPGQCNRHGLEFRLEDPPLIALEAQLKYGGKPGSSVLPGTLRIGGLYHFGDFENQRFDTGGVSLGDISSNGIASEEDGNSAVYGVIDQQIYRVPGSDDKGVAIFGRAVFAPSDRNEIDLSFDGGVVFTGMPRRPDDAFGIAAFYTGLSDSVSGLDRDAASPVIRDYEFGVEVSYTAQLLPGLALQPNFKYIWNPGGGVADDSGFRAVDDAAIFGIRTSVSY